MVWFREIDGKLKALDWLTSLDEGDICGSVERVIEKLADLKKSGDIFVMMEGGEDSASIECHIVRDPTENELRYRQEENEARERRYERDERAQLIQLLEKYPDVREALHVRESEQ